MLSLYLARIILHFFHFFFRMSIMANKRSDESKGVIVMFRADFLRKIDEALPIMGYNDRSSLIRDAVYMLLQKHGIQVTPIEKTITGRAGKGGRPPKEKDLVPVAGTVEAKQNKRA
jgi:Arc/MetJ-type ribon-helix-helix transcriptional regulator